MRARCRRRPGLLWPWVCLLVMVSSASGAWAQSPEQPADESPAQSPASYDLSSPEAALLETYFPAMNAISRGQGDLEAQWQQALAALDWRDAMTEAEARGAAQDLLFVFDRLGRIEPADLLDRRTVQEAGITRFVLFPQATEDHQAVWQTLREAGHPTPDREAQIVLAQTEPGRWQVTAETLAGIDALAETLQPLPPAFSAAGDAEIDPADRVFGFLGETFAQTPYWAWGALLGAIFLGLLVGKIVSTMLRSSGERLEKRGWYVRGIALQDAASPASLAIFTLGLTVGFQFIHRTDDLATFTEKIVTFLYLIAVGWFLFNLVNIIEVALRKVTLKTSNKLDDMIVPLIRKALRIFVVIIFSFVVAENVFGLDMTGWLAGLGIAGLAISLAAQDSVKNLFGSLTVFFDHPFKVGDYISFSGHSGTVEEIGFRSTRIRLLSGHLVTMPNMKFIDQDVENISLRPSIRREMNIRIARDTPVEKITEGIQIVKDILNDSAIVAEGRFDMEKQPPRVAFNELNADSLNIRAYYWYQMAGDSSRGFYTYLDHCELVNLKLFAQFGEAGIAFAFPTQTLYLAGDEKRQLALRLLQNEQPSHGDSAGDGER